MKSSIKQNSFSEISQQADPKASSLSKIRRIKNGTDWKKRLSSNIPHNRKNIPSIAQIERNIKAITPQIMKDAFEAQKAEKERRTDVPVTEIWLKDDIIETQSERIIRKFGGIHELRKVLTALGKPRNASSIYRWLYTKEKGGTGGLIPVHIWSTLFAAARLQGILLTPEDFGTLETIRRESKLIANNVDGKLIPFIPAPHMEVLRKRAEAKKAKKQARIDKQKRRTAKKRRKRELKRLASLHRQKLRDEAWMLKKQELYEAHLNRLLLRQLKKEKQ